MSFFKKLFGGGDEAPVQKVQNTNNVQFGRYTDKGKTKKQLDFWKQATEDYKNKSYANSFKNFLNYVRDETIDNLTVKEISGSELEFEFVQGSKIIRGKANNDRFTATAAIVKMEKSSTAVMRKLMQINYNLKYSKFSIHEDVVYLRFSTSAIDASPFKLYDALKELARNADKQDDLLVSEFSSLKEIDTHKIIELSQEVKDIKYKYLVKWINDTIKDCEEVDSDKFSGGISFMLLNLLYKIDYLLVPEGELTDKLEKMQNQYFVKSDASTMTKNKALIEGFKEVLDIPKEKVLEGIYQVKATFPYVNPSVRKTVMDKIFDEKKKIQWYKDNKYPKIVRKMYEYIWGYSFFNYGMDKPDRQILDLMFNLYDQDYYAELGFASDMIVGDKLNEKAIRNRINSIIKQAKVDYPNIKIDTNFLKFNDLVSFSDSMINQMDKMNYTK